VTDEGYFYGGKIRTKTFQGGRENAQIKSLDPNNEMYYGSNREGEAPQFKFGGPHAMADGRIALEYDVLMNESEADSNYGTTTAPYSISVLSRVYCGGPGDVFDEAVREAKRRPRPNHAVLDDNERNHKEYAYLGRDDWYNVTRGMLWAGDVPETRMRATASCTFSLPSLAGYSSSGILDPPEYPQTGVQRPLGMGSGRYENAVPIEKLH
jgi:hypothetical protein